MSLEKTGKKVVAWYSGGSWTPEGYVEMDEYRCTRCGKKMPHTETYDHKCK